MEVAPVCVGLLYTEYVSTQILFLFYRHIEKSQGVLLFELYSRLNTWPYRVEVFLELAQFKCFFFFTQAVMNIAQEHIGACGERLQRRLFIGLAGTGLPRGKKWAVPLVCLNNSSIN